MPHGDPDPALHLPAAIDDLDDPGEDVVPAALGLPVTATGVDTDGDGEPDTVLTEDGADLVVHTDLDGDGLADRLLRIGPGGTAVVGPGAPAVLDAAGHGGDIDEGLIDGPGPWWSPWRWWAG